MNIEQHISQLLYRYQCVTVPGFGAFLCEIQSAMLDESTHSFYPPKKLISFNPYLKNNDGLLANHIAVAENISYEIAVSLLQIEVSQWKNKLQEHRSFSIKNIGEISLNNENNLLFTPFDQVNYLTESFGLSTFVSPVIKREVFKEEIQILEETAPIAFTPEKRRSYTFLKYAAVFVITLGISGLVGLKMYEKNIEEETLLVETKVQEKVNQKIQEATFFIENPLPTVTLTIKEDVYPYHIVAGAFRHEDNAQKTFEELTELGYNARRVSPNKHGLHPVLYGSYTSYSEAQDAMKEIKKNHNKDAWLLIEEL